MIEYVINRISGEAMSTLLREIEVKYRVAEPSELARTLTTRGAVFSEPVRQDDQAYAVNGWTYGQSKAGAAFARLRTENGRHTFCVKKPLENELACAEHETEVVERESMHAAILAMGFYPTTRIVKSRRTARIDDMLLCIDEVDGLGAFFEIEVLVEDDRSAVEVQQELDRFARTLGVELVRSTETYDSLMRAAVPVGG
ncbi:CYTH domain-containing protein [Micromonospora sp. WMMD987]|uniref:class IV adenylate cyclase n=1 Tax=Micromonospora sp. WMMD987 TaxID=3016089 RepID=UPI00249A45BF|nr:CYTH domain-containing protein [Micromonospora sp. WMMD987]WFE96562.1 CYTH domain-containing protein [Micromonospora sp. WMMD987]